MKKILLLCLILGSLNSITIAQDKTQGKSKSKTIEQKLFPDLLALFVDEKYEKCLYKAEKYTLKEETAKQALPYLFISRCYFEMSKRDEFKEKYPNAAKDCLKFATKYSTKDKERTFYAEHEDYFTEIRNKAIGEAELSMDNKKYSQSKTYYDYLTDWDSNDAGAWIMMGICFELSKQKKEAENTLKKAQTLLTEKTCSVEIKGQKDLLKNALIAYADKLYTEGNSAQAKIWLNLGKEWFMDDKEYQVTYSQYAN
jgi:hypothetical protein